MKHFINPKNCDHDYWLDVFEHKDTTYAVIRCKECNKVTIGADTKRN